MGTVVESIPVLRPGGKKKDCSGNDRIPRASRLRMFRTEVDDVEGYALEGPTEETANVTFVREKRRSVRSYTWATCRDKSARSKSSLVTVV